MIANRGLEPLLQRIPTHSTTCWRPAPAPNAQTLRLRCLLLPPDRQGLEPSRHERRIEISFAAQGQSIAADILIGYTERFAAGCPRINVLALVRARHGGKERPREGGGNDAINAQRPRSRCWSRSTARPFRPVRLYCFVCASRKRRVSCSATIFPFDAADPSTNR